MLGAAGGAELIAAMMALSQGLLPPTLHLDSPDPECDSTTCPAPPAWQAQLASRCRWASAGTTGCWPERAS